MKGEEWEELVNSLVAAKRCLAAAWATLDGTDGAAAASEHALGAALSAIDAVYGIESEHAFNQDVASHVQDFWEQNGSLPGFAAGTQVAHGGWASRGGPSARRRGSSWGILGARTPSDRAFRVRSGHQLRLCGAIY